MRTTNNSKATALVGALLVALAFGIAIVAVVFKLWLIGSLVTSGVKSISGNCANVYAIEKTGVSGNWFCPSK